MAYLNERFDSLPKGSPQATACPQCGCPISPPPEAKPDDAHGSCYACEYPATRPCSHCGNLCCSEHSTWFHTIRNAGAVCRQCANSQWILTVVFLAVMAIVLIVSGLLKLKNTPLYPFGPAAATSGETSAAYF